MQVTLPYGKTQFDLHVPDDAIVYQTAYPSPPADPSAAVLDAVRRPIESAPLVEAVRAARPESVVVVVSDITRPIPYHAFLPGLLAEIVSAGVARDAVTILVATGMHRPSTPDEHEHMFGPEACKAWRIVDHRSDDPSTLARLDVLSHGGRPIELNRQFVEADFRITTGLVEPHFMAGFSGGRKSVCPGLCSLETVKAFHSFAFLDDPAARNANLLGNPLHDEALSIARAAGVHFTVNVVVNRDHRVVDVFAGDLEAAHAAACDAVRAWACPPVETLADTVLTSSGGYPLDATFYQCVKGMRTAAAAVRPGGTVIATGSCLEGIGSDEYVDIHRRYANRWRDFNADCRRHGQTARDQWEFQMQAQILAHVGDDNLIFLTDGLSAADLADLSVQGEPVTPDVLAATVQTHIDSAVARGDRLAILPEGPYCAPTP